MQKCSILSRAIKIYANSHTCMRIAFASTCACVCMHVGRSTAIAAQFLAKKSPPLLGHLGDEGTDVLKCSQMHR